MDELEMLKLLRDALNKAICLFPDTVRIVVPEPEQPSLPDPEPESDGKHDRESLKRALDQAGVQYNPKTRTATMITLLQEHAEKVAAEEVPAEYEEHEIKIRPSQTKEPEEPASTQPVSVQELRAQIGVYMQHHKIDEVERDIGGLLAIYGAEKVSDLDPEDRVTVMAQVKEMCPNE